MSSNAIFDAPKGFCARHGVGFVMSEGCLGCKSKLIEVHKKNGLDTSNLPKDALNVVSMRIFSREELSQSVIQGKLVRLKLDDDSKDYALLAGDAYIFFSIESRDKLYFAISNTQAAELTIKLNLPLR